MKGRGAPHAGAVFAGHTQTGVGAQAQAQKDRVVVTQQRRDGDTDPGLDPAADLHPEGAHVVHLAQGVFGVDLVRGDARGVEPAGELALLEDHRAVPLQREVGRAGEGGRARAEEGDLARGGDHPLGAQGLRTTPGLGVERRLGGEALQPADLDRGLVPRVVDTRAHAQDLHRADPRAGVSEDVLREDRPRGAEGVAGGDLSDEARDVDLRGARHDARRVGAEQAPLGLRVRLSGRVLRLGLGQAGLQSPWRRLGHRHRVAPSARLQRTPAPSPR
jgi:hypothetical protein